MTVISNRDFEQLMDAIENPPEPNEALKKTVRAYREFLHSISLTEKEVQEIEQMLLKADLED